MVRAFWVLPFGWQRVSVSVFTTTERTPSAAKFIATIMPTGPPPIMTMGGDWSPPGSIMRLFLAGAQYSSPDQCGSATSKRRP